MCVNIYVYIHIQIYRYIFETRSHYVGLDSLEVAMETRLAYRELTALTFLVVGLKAFTNTSKEKCQYCIFLQHTFPSSGSSILGCFLCLGRSDTDDSLILGIVSPQILGTSISYESPH